MRKGIIYKWTNKITGESYIGQTIHEEERKLAHEQCTGNSKFHKALRYYGLINFEYEKLEEVDEDKLDEREIYWIRYYDSKNHGYNTLKGGQPKLKEITKTKKELGLYFGGNVRFGYKVNDNKEFEINKEEAKIVKMLFEDYSSKKYSLKQLSKKYNNISFGTIHNIICRPCYYGNDPKYPAIISKELFDKAQLSKTSKKLNYKKNDHLLKGKIYDEYNNQFTTNNSINKFINTKTNKTISFSIIDTIIKEINNDYDKIVVIWISCKERKFDIIKDDKVIQTIYHNCNHR